MQYDPQNATLVFDKKEGSFATKYHVITLVLHGFTSDEVKGLAVNGNPTTINQQQIRFFTSHFTFADYGPFDTKNVLTASFPNSDNEITVHW
jgi:alpha-glucosidase